MKFIKRIYLSIPDYFKNRYWLTIILFVCWMAFFDNNNFWSQVSLKFELNDLRNQKEKVLQDIKVVKERHYKLLNDPKEQERFAREKYWMKKKDEDIFIGILQNHVDLQRICQIVFDLFTGNIANNVDYRNVANNILPKFPTFSPKPHQQMRMSRLL